MPVLIRLSCLWVLAFGLGAFAAWADEPVVTLKPGSDSLPDVFSKSVPESVNDLKAFESHLQQLLPRLNAATVALRIRDAHGSGVIVSASGLVMTAGHVSGRPGREVEITLTDGRRVFGRTLGRNSNLDSGLIQIDGDRADWPFCPLVPQQAESPPVKLGDWCISMGHPGGYQAGRTAPVRLGRVVLLTNRLIQTDCELVGGDSGGPLFNMRGEVIGNNSRIGQPLEFNFHVPTRVYQEEWDALSRSEDIDWSTDRDTARSVSTKHGALLGLSGKTDVAGLKVSKVYPDEPAAWAGIQVDDILVTFDAQRVTDMTQLKDLVREQLPGDEVRVELLRAGQKVELMVELDVTWD